MRHCLFISMLLLACLVGIGCEQQETLQKPKASTDPVAGQERATKDEPPLLLDDEPPLLLDDSPDADLLDGSGADNSRCFVCHINYKQEAIAVIHARTNIGCAGCHGESDAHIADESWASGGNGTPPDIMYPRPKINSFCMGCHTKEKINTEQHKLIFAINAEEKYCTDCHGNHRLANRKCKWK